MGRIGLIAGIVAAVAVAGWLVLRSGTAGNEASARAAVLDRYCISCHNDTELAGGASFEGRAHDAVDGHAEMWEAVVRKLRTGLMPPQGEPRPERAVLDELAAGLERELDAAWARAPSPGAKALARLNRTEYINAIRDLLAFDATAIAAALPIDRSVAGFDNIAAELSVSPTLLEGYALAAMQIGRRAIGDRTLGHGETTYRAAAGLAQQRHIDGLPLGTRGGLAVEHDFPLDGEYVFVVAATLPEAGWANPTGRLVWCNPPTVDVAFNDVPLALADFARFRLRVPAGRHRITVALVDEQRCTGVNELYSGEVALEGSIQSLVIDGPYDATGVGDTPSRRAILTCEPTAASDEAVCARQILSRLARRAYRGAVAADGVEVDTLLEFYRRGREEGGDFEAGLQYALSRLLVDPRFLYRFEHEPDDVAVGSVYPLDDLALASRLSFFVWSSIPDDELLDLAGAKRLHEPEVLRAQVARLLADDRAVALVDNFAGQWLRLRELDELPTQDAEFDADLRAAFRAETERVFGDLLREPRSVLRLLDTDYTYLNERLAQHYGIAGVQGGQLRRVELPADSPRRGLLGHGSLLTATSPPNRTSPVVRGAWIVENVLGAEVPSPPPGVEADLAKEASAAAGLVGDTVRERLEVHRTNPTCAACHAIMDPLGLALENFDLVGRWRETEDGHPIDARARMTDGTELDGPAALRQALLTRGEMFVTAFTERLMTYALGRELTYQDRPAVRAIVRQTAADDHTLPALIQGVVASDAFRKRVKVGGETPAVAQRADSE